MNFTDEMTQLTIGTTNHANNFNQIHNKLLDNDKYLANQIDVLSTNKADKNNAAFTGTMTLNGNEVATTEKTEISSSLFKNNWQMNGSSTSLMKVGNNVTASICCRNGNMEVNTIVFSIPIGYRPKTDYFTSGMFSTTSLDRSGKGTLLNVGSDGNVTLIYTIENNDNLRFQLSHEGV